MKNRAPIIAITSIDKYALAGVIAQLFGAANITSHMCRRQPAPFTLEDFSEHYNLDGLFYQTRNVPEKTKEAIREIITSLSSPQSTESLGLEEIYGRLSKVETDFAQLEQQMERLRVGAQNPLINHTYSHDFFSRAPAKSAGYVTVDFPPQENCINRQP